MPKPNGHAHPRVMLSALKSAVRHAILEPAAFPVRHYHSAFEATTGGGV